MSWVPARRTRDRNKPYDSGRVRADGRDRGVATALDGA